jgi:uncharacterized protein (TIGR01319 family)
VTYFALDVGSTWTKGALVSDVGEVLATAQAPTTHAEVMDGINDVRESLGAHGLPVLACSSAGGGLRLAIIGKERLVSAEAGYRVALSAGAKTAGVLAGSVSPADVARLDADVLLLVGGTDGGDRDTVLGNAKAIAATDLSAPVVYAGNKDARAQAEEILTAAGKTVICVANVLPDIGELAPQEARAAIRELFLSHVIGGKKLSATTEFLDMVSMVTPDAVLVGVAELATGQEGAVLVVDVGGATTDVYSAVSQPRETQHAVALGADRRTVEGDLGLRWSAERVVAEAEAERLVANPAALHLAAAYRAAHPDYLPTTDAESAMDLELATLAVIIALRRHLRLIDDDLGPRGAGLLLLSGGVFRHATTTRHDQVFERLRADPVLRPVLRSASLAVDERYLLAPLGLLKARKAS